jgi:hypothetical protein
VPIHSTGVTDDESKMKEGSGKTSSFFLFSFRLVVYVLLAAILIWLVFYRAVNLDEGWYLTASRSVYDGRLLYRDFAYTQAPVLPYVYGLTSILPGGPLYAGRVLTLLFALAALYLAGRTARRLAGPRAEILTLLLFASSLYAVAFYTYTATYALTALCIALAVNVAVEQPREQLRNVVATFCICLAVGVRLSAVAALPPLLLFLAWRSRRRGRAFGTVSLTAALTLAAISLPFMLAAGPQTVGYNIFGFHTDRMLPEWQVAVSRNAVRETVQAFPLMLLAAGAALAVTLRPARAQDTALRDHRSLRAVVLTLLAMSAGMAVVHLVPRTAGGYYNALQAPLLALAGGVTLAPLAQSLGQRARRPWVRGTLAVLALSVLLVNGVVQFRLLQAQAIIARPPFRQVEQVRKAGAYLAAHTPPGEPLITFNAHLALEAARPVPPGFEMGIFSYRPTWTTEQATRNHAVNNEMLHALLSRGEMPVALTSFDLQTLYGDTDRLLATLNEQYRWTKSVPRFGPFFDEVRLYFPPQHDAPTPQRPRRALLAEGITLLGYDLERDAYGGAESLRLGLYWQARAAPQRAYTVFTHLLDEAGSVAAGQDNPPCRNTCPTDTWRSGEVIRDEYILPLKPGSYILEIGMYDAISGERLPVLSESGALVDDRIVLETVEVR